ncbi:hypothetical protein QR680_005172 [Steinernema hermaphroditum]|uniref:Uncharacterized protein n=1 Tax=Steinernema hermaphroditum TaxID=289476 RepID=A0AA39LUD8_9BILA|nr:hypothetical protein QR680_005172 [Steinernema hermaphroditum]
MIFEIPLDHFPQPYSMAKTFQLGPRAAPSMPQLLLERPTTFTLQIASQSSPIQVQFARSQELKQIASATVSAVRDSATHVVGRFLSCQPTFWRSNS